MPAFSFTGRDIIFQLRNELLVCHQPFPVHIRPITIRRFEEFITVLKVSIITQIPESTYLRLDNSPSLLPPLPYSAQKQQSVNK